MFTMNEITLMGNVTKDFEVKVLDNGTAVCTLNLATGTRSYKSKDGEWQDPTAFHQIEFWGKKAEQMGNLGVCKGTTLLIKGYMKSGKYENKDGHNVYTYKVIGEDFRLIPKVDKQASAPVAPQNNLVQEAAASLGVTTPEPQATDFVGYLSNSVADDIPF